MKIKLLVGSTLLAATLNVSATAHEGDGGKVTYATDKARSWSPTAI